MAASILISPTPAASAQVAKIEIQAITDSKTGEVEVTFLSKSSKSLIASYQIDAKPVGASGLGFSKSYSKKVSGYITQKVSPLAPGVEYIFTVTQRSVDKKVTKSTPYVFTPEPTSPGAPRITSASATDSDEALIYFDAPGDDGGSPILSYTVTTNPGQIITTSNQQVGGSITALGLTKATTYTFTITAQNLYGRSEPSLISTSVTTLAQKIVIISTLSTTPALAAPAFTLSSSSETRTVNTPATGFTSSSTGGVIASFAISATPPGMSFSTSTGALSGTPTSIAGATAYTITATNATGSATRTFTFTVTAVVYTFGQRGPGGGIVYYVSATNFTSTGSTCNTACKYLEVAPATWKSETTTVANDPLYLWSSNTTVATGQDITTASTEGIPAQSANEKFNWKIGQGFYNTSVMKVSGATSAAQAAVLAYAGGSSAGQWFIPSMNELNELCKYARGQTTGVLTVACDNSGTLKTGTANDLGGFVAHYYWSSSELSVSDARYQDFTVGTVGNYSKNDPNSFVVRPVRAF